MHVFVTGATGFVGSYVLRALLAHGHTARCLVREGSRDKLPVPPDETVEVDRDLASVAAGEALPRSRARVEVVYGDILDVDSIQGDMAGCDAVVHLVGIIDEEPAKGVTFEAVHKRGTRHVVEEARAAGIERFVHMSANGARPDGKTGYQTSKWAAEEIVRGAGFAHAVVFRPSIVFGDPEGREEFASRLADTLVRPFPILPVLGDGQYRLQPVHVTAVAEAFAQALEADEAAGQAYCVGGAEALTFDEVLDRISEAAVDHRKPKVHQPLWLAKAAVYTVGELGLLPISPAQFEMLIEGNTCADAAWRDAFDVPDVPFTPEHLGYLKQPKGA